MSLLLYLIAEITTITWTLYVNKAVAKKAGQKVFLFQDQHLKCLKQTLEQYLKLL